MLLTIRRKNIEKTPSSKIQKEMLIAFSDFRSSWSKGLAVTVAAINNFRALLCIWGSSPLIGLVRASLTRIDFVGFVTEAWLSTAGCTVAVTVSVSGHLESRTLLFKRQWNNHEANCEILDSIKSVNERW